MSSSTLTRAVAALTVVTAVNGLATVLDNRVRFRQRQNEQRVLITRIHSDLLRDLAAHPDIDLWGNAGDLKLQANLLYANRWMSLWSLMHRVGFTSPSAIRTTAARFMENQTARDYWFRNRDWWRQTLVDQVDARFYVLVDEEYEGALKASHPDTIPDLAT